MYDLIDRVASHLGLDWSAVLDIYGVPATLSAGALLLVLLVALAVSAPRRSRKAMRQVAELASRHAIEERQQQMQAAAEAQFAEIKGRLSAIAELTAQAQAEQARGLNERIDMLSSHLAQNLGTFSDRVGGDLAEAGRRTSDSLVTLNQRLAVIEDARRNLAALSSEVVSLQGVLTDKQARGAFGQMRMETIIRDALPAGAYEFQATLSNGKRPDCLIRLPNTPAPLVIDSKFPLEGFEALRVAHTAEKVKAASQLVRESVSRHVDEIAERYLIAGETQDTALMFVPSESVYADLHERFSDLVQRGHRARVMIVAPNVLMLAVQTMQAIIKDVRMRDQAGVIQREVGQLLGDVARLVERVGELDRHFNLSVKALEKVTGSADKIARRGGRLRSLDLGDDAPSAPTAPCVAAGDLGAT
jgi:DNA recombination protein RmuC